MLIYTCQFAFLSLVFIQMGILFMKLPGYASYSCYYTGIILKLNLHLFSVKLSKND